MSRGVYVALSGAVAQEQALDTTAQNLANATTVGYQKMRPIFNEALAGASKNGQALHYEVVNRTAVDTSRGPIRQTGNGSDIALPENQYLAVTNDKGGEKYTRNGELKMSNDGILRAGGAPVVREDGKPMQLSPADGQPTISQDGTVMQKGQIVGQLKLMKPDANVNMVHEGNGLMVPQNNGTMTQVQNPQVETGVLEDSNASVVGSMTDMVQASRTFEAFQKMLDTLGDCDRKVLTTTPMYEE